MKALVLLALLGFLKGAESDAVSDASSTLYPEITCPCENKLEGPAFCRDHIIPAGQKKIALKWDETKITTFPDGLKKTLAAGSPSLNSEVGPGTYVIRYIAEDDDGRRASCEFFLDVVGAQCPGLPDVQHGRSTCPQGAIQGQICSVVCEEGYEVLGSNGVECLISNSYSGKLTDCDEVAYYKRVCDSIASSPANHFMDNVESNMTSMKNMLLQSGALPNHDTLNIARTVCRNETLKSHAACVFIRRHDFFINIKKDGSHTTKPYRAFLLLHPEIKSFCQRTPFLNTLYEAFPDVEKFFNEPYQKIFEGAMTKLFTEMTGFLRNESTQTCANKKQLSDCLMKDIFEMIDRAQKFMGKKTQLGNKWRNRELNHYFNALTFSAVLIKWNYLKLVDGVGPRTNRGQQDVLTQILRALAEFVDDGADEKVRFMTEMFPEVVTDKICNNGKMCMFWRVVDQTRLYVGLRKEDATTPSGTVKVRVIDTTIDMRRFLELKQMDRILQLLADQEYNLIEIAKDLKSEFNKVVNDRFSELKSYFQKVHKFNSDIAKADLVVIKQIRSTSIAADVLARELDEDMKYVFVQMIRTVSVNLAGKIQRLALVILENCNPLKAITDASPSDIFDAMSQMMHALAKLAKAVKLVASVNVLARAGQIVATGIASNQQFLTTMNETMTAVIDGNKPSTFTEAKNKFLKTYDQYDPRLKRHQITEMGAYYKEMMGEACSLIRSTDSLWSAIPKGIIAEKGTCWKVQVKIDTLIAMYESIFDKQFEMTEVLARNVKAQVGIEAANGMVSELTSVSKAPSVSDDVLQKLQQIAGMSYLSYRVMIIQAIRLYCDKLEYNNGGIRPTVCMDSATDVSSLLAYVPNRCITKLEFLTMPTYPRGPRDRAFLNLKSLYAGKETMFKIPNSKWLYMNKWITKADVNSTIYVASIEIYLPTNATTRVNVRTDTYVEGTNELKPGGKQYDIRPKKPMRFDYIIEGGKCRFGTKFDSPYNTCPEKKLPSICQQTEYPCFLDVGKRPYLPSIFSTFKVRMYGYETHSVPDPTHSLPIKIGLRSCTFVSGKLSDDVIDEFKEQGPKRTVPTCCPDNTFWYSRYQRCEACRANSTVRLNGYYCGKTT